MRFFPSLLCTLIPGAVLAGPVDINTADAATLAKELNGVGPARAQAIVAYRNEHGPFKSVDDLALVKNMPRKVIEANRENLRMDGRATRADKAAQKPEARADTGAKGDSKSPPRP
ncbi:MAG TPA: helix-hairpin-helix domain-containing protein [Steroidobacteraceae bacterium]|jgi:competence protein ComEA